MKNQIKIALLSAAVAVASITPTMAALIAYEGFNYTPGTDLATQTQPPEFNAWKAGATPGYTPVAGSLSYSSGGTLATSGNSMTGGNAYQTTGMRLDLSNTAWDPYKTTVPDQWGGFPSVIGQDNSTLYVSFLLQCTNDVAHFGLYSDIYTNSDPFTQLALGAVLEVSSFGALTLRVGSYTAGTFDVIPPNATDGVPPAHAVQDASATAVTAGSVNLYVMKIEFGASGNGQDRVSLFVNPTLGGAEPGTASASITANGNLVFSAMGIYLGNTAGSGKADEIRFGATWDDVIILIPEPGTVALLLGGVGSLLLFRRRV